VTIITVFLRGDFNFEESITLNNEILRFTQE